MHEYESIEDLDTIAQGDVIEWVGDHRQPPWYTFGVVVTADCDLAHGKHKGYISYVPALQAQDFVWYHWRPEVVGPARSRAFALVSKRLTSWREKNGEGGEISTAALESWLRRVGAEKLLDELGVADRGQRNTLMAVIKPAEALDECIRCDEPNMHHLTKAFVHIKKSQNFEPNLLSKDLQQYFSQLPGDIFHIPSAPYDEGDDLFLLLRHIRQAHSEEITARPDDIRTGKARGKRIARVTAPLRYAITQNSASLF